MILTQAHEISTFTSDSEWWKNASACALDLCSKSDYLKDHPEIISSIFNHLKVAITQAESIKIGARLYTKNLVLSAENMQFIINEYTRFSSKDLQLIIIKHKSDPQKFALGTAPKHKLMELKYDVKNHS